jgi:hypothetical protein
MTMMNGSHPDDERLAAFAAADRDAVDDRALHEHVASCARCSDLVLDLTSLRTMLAELPDIAPSRPLRLLPPLPEPAPRGRLPWLRRLVAPTMVVGIGLVFVGTVGTAANLGSAVRLNFLNAGEAAGASPQEPVMSRHSQSADSGDRNPPTARPSSLYGSAGSPVPTGASLQPGTPAASPSEVPAALGGSSDKSASPEAPLSVPAAAWLLALVAGLGLILLGLVLRFAVQPRAG